MSYKHLSIYEREKIAIYRALSFSICVIAILLGLHWSPEQISNRLCSTRQKNAIRKTIAAKSRLDVRLAEKDALP